MVSFKSIKLLLINVKNVKKPTDKVTIKIEAIKIFCFIILAAGESKRFKSKKPKPYYLYRGKPLFLHSINRAKESNKFKKIVLVINKKHKRFLRNARLKNVKIISGGMVYYNFWYRTRHIN